MAVYRLKEMIDKKYGKGKFDTGCEIVARWLAFETKTEVTAADVKTCCQAEAEQEFKVSPEFLAALKKLFGFKSDLEFYTKKQLQSI